MPKNCDHTSVGMLVWQNDRLLLIERKKLPFGFAPPAGHVDDKGTFQKAATEELFEEVGLRAQALELLTEGGKNNPCRRQDGTWHYWKIYRVVATGAIQPSSDETKQAGFYTKKNLQHLAKKTEQYLAGQISEKDWENSPGLEPVWHEWLTELKII